MSDAAEAEASGSKYWVSATQSVTIPDFAPETLAGGVVFRSVLRERRAWKTFGDGETVWPPAVEAALIEGLEKYQPEDSRETRLLGRFPRRNHFISEYILEKTGKRRSAKQVGSRLQQLRDSRGNARLMAFLWPVGDCARPEEMFDTALPAHNVIYIDITPEHSPCYFSAAVRQSQWIRNGPSLHVQCSHPRRLTTIDPTIAFTSKLPMVANSWYTVYREDIIMHAEVVPLVLLEEQAPGSLLLYTTKLIPSYWSVILESPDPTQFTIHQEVIGNTFHGFSATYKFRYPLGTLSTSPLSFKQI